MKKISLILSLLFIISYSNDLIAQKKIRNLKVYVVSDFNPKSSITVEGLSNDTEGVANRLY